MAKSKYQESCMVSIEGIYDHENKSIEVEEIGTKALEDIMAKFNGANIKM
jgi:hypothetical protein